VVRHLSAATTAEDILDGLANIDLDVIRVKQMPTTLLPYAEGTTRLDVPDDYVYDVEVP
jgi:hypothetical protein